jgi:predicted RNase H-like HicB family nuclease
MRKIAMSEFHGAPWARVPGLGAAGKTLDEVKELIRESVEFHLEGMRHHGDPVPVPSAITEYITV